MVLLVAMGSALWTIRPRRGRRNDREGVLDPARIARFPSVEPYAQAFRELDSRELEVQMLERAYDFSWIDREKYRWLNAALILSALGWLLAIFVLWQVALS